MAGKLDDLSLMLGGLVRGQADLDRKITDFLRQQESQTAAITSRFSKLDSDVAAIKLENMKNSTIIGGFVVSIGLAAKWALDKWI